MSDFIFSNLRQAEGWLGENIQSIYQYDKPAVTEFHGDWGSLASSRNLYNGFQPIETGRHILTVIGGPVLYFTNNRFLTGNSQTAGTQAIYERYLAGKMCWDEDLSGPFVVLVIDKLCQEVICVTDLMMFIPVYQHAQNGKLVLGTHADALAKNIEQVDALDFVSLADFILNGVVTYPYTTYKNLRQLHPSAIHSFKSCDKKLQPAKPNIYWLPKEINPYIQIKQAASALREGLQDYIKRVTENMTEVALFLSAGEDSRLIASLLPKRLKRDANIFLDSINREYRIAELVAKAYGINFHVAFRNATHYLDILPEASNLIGSGYQYTHTHSLGFHKSCNLSRYFGVFGGFLSDTLIKGLYVKKFKGYGLDPFLFQLEDKKSSPIYSKIMKNSESLLTGSIYGDLIKRKIEHYKRIQGYRANSFKEWFNLWPIITKEIPYFSINRRLFCTYEPFMCKQAIKISTAVPTSWKLNRRLFHCMAKSLFEPTKYLPHGDGWLPYSPWQIMSRVSIRLRRKVGKRIGLVKGNQGPWGDWKAVMESDAWENLVATSITYGKCLREIFYADVKQLIKSNILKREQKINLLQVLYSLRHIDKR